MGASEQSLDDRSLQTVADPWAGAWVEANREISPERFAEGEKDRDRRLRSTALDVRDERLRDARRRGQPSLADATVGAELNKLLPDCPTDLLGSTPDPRPQTPPIRATHKPMKPDDSSLPLTQ